LELLHEKIKEAVRLLEQSHYTVVLAGAGISEESGIADFRSSDRGLWTMLDPDDFIIKSARRTCWLHRRKDYLNILII